MKYIIFLDVDGVLHPLNEKHLPSNVKMEELYQRVEEEEEAGDSLEMTRILEGEFMPDIMQRLSKTIDTCAAAATAATSNNSVSIVLSSTWRETVPGRRAVNTKLKEFGIPIVSSCTPHLQSMHVRCTRAHEIVHWLCKKVASDKRGGAGEADAFRFVVLDDADLLGDETMQLGTDGSDYAADFIRPYFVRCDKSVGLTETDCQQALSILQARTGMNGNNYKNNNNKEEEEEKEKEKEKEAKEGEEEKKMAVGVVLPEEVVVLVNKEMEEIRRRVDSVSGEEEEEEDDDDGGKARMYVHTVP